MTTWNRRVRVTVTLAVSNMLWAVASPDLRGVAIGPGASGIEGYDAAITHAHRTLVAGAESAVRAHTRHPEPIVLTAVEHRVPAALTLPSADWVWVHRRYD